MQRLTVVLLLLACAISYISAQNMQLANDILVAVNGDTLYSPWAGAMSAPQFGQTDLNGDGKQDFVVFDRVDWTFTPYLNVSTQVGQRDYQFSPAFKTRFDSCHCAGWAEFVDYDCDGDNDIFCGTPSSNIVLYENVQINTDSFIYMPLYSYMNPINSTYTNYTSSLYSALMDYPAIYDVDKDGDVDFLTFGSAVNIVELHINKAIETYNRCDTIVFEFDTGCWGHFSENASNCQVKLHDTLLWCTLNGFHPNFRQDSITAESEQSRDAGSTLLALDLNQNQLTDLLVGDVSCNTVSALINNVGTLQHAYIDSLQTNYPQNTTPINLTLFPALFYWDTDGDGVKDLIYAPNDRDKAEDFNAVGLYKNLGQNDYPNFQYQGRGFIQNQTLEFGTSAAPAFFDYNQDGKLDILVGNFGYFSTSDAAFHARLALLENVGNNDQPIFSLVTDNYLPYIVANDNVIKNVTPAVGDLDADGDDDLLFGGALGNIYYFRNEGLAGGVADFQFVTSTFANITGASFNNSAPTLYDIDNDSDLDLFMGVDSGYVAFYQNNGTPQSASFDLVTTRWGNVKVKTVGGNGFGNAKPILYDYDQDGQINLLIGTLSGNVEIYHDLSLIPNDTFTFVGNLFGYDFGSFSAPTAAIIDSSGKPTFVVGNKRGGLQLFKVPYYVAPDTSGVAIQAGKEKTNWTLFPNPTTKEVHIIFEEDMPNTHISLYNMLGQELFRITTTEQESVISLVTLSPGMYFVRIENEKQSDTKKLVVK